MRFLLPLSCLLIQNLIFSLSALQFSSFSSTGAGSITKFIFRDPNNTQTSASSPNPNADDSQSVQSQQEGGNLRGSKKNAKKKLRDYFYALMGENPHGSQYKYKPETLVSKQEKTYNETYQHDVCTYSNYDFQDPSYNMMNVDNANSVLYPGCLVQSKVVSTGTSSLVNIPIPEKYRYSIKVATDQNIAPRMANGSSAADVGYTIKQMLTDLNTIGSGTVFYSLQTSEEVSQLFSSLEINGKILDKLGFQLSASGDWRTKKNKIAMTFIQSIASFYVSM